MPDFKVDETRLIKFKGRICVPIDMELKKEILAEAYSSGYTLHPGGNKMYQDMKSTFWWNGMKKDVRQYVSECPTYQQVKAEH